LRHHCLSCTLCFRSVDSQSLLSLMPRLENLGKKMLYFGVLRRGKCSAGYFVAIDWNTCKSLSPHALDYDRGTVWTDSATTMLVNIAFSLVCVSCCFVGVISNFVLCWDCRVRSNLIWDAPIFDAGRGKISRQEIHGS
jgi:hypothetical protein